MKLKYTIMPILLVLLTSVLISCMTQSPVSEPSTITAQIADVNIEFVYLDRDTLIERHGSNLKWNQNPFVDYPGIMPRKNIFVLDTLIRTKESAVEFDIAEIRLAIEEKSGKAVSYLYLRNLWKAYEDDRGWSRIMNSSKDYMFPNEFTADPEKPAKGYLVFPYNYGVEGGRGMISITLRTPDGDRGILDIPIIVSENGIELLEGSGESGIFAED